MSLVSTHLRRHRGALATTYAVIGIENVFELLYPFAASQTRAAILITHST